MEIIFQHKIDWKWIGQDPQVRGAKSNQTAHRPNTTLPPQDGRTWTMAGSWGSEQVGLGGSHTVRSLMSLPLKMMYSNVSSRGGIGRSVGRSSVPNERTVRGGNKVLLESQVKGETGFRPPLLNSP